MQDVSLLLARQAEAVWKFPDLSLNLGPRIKPSLMHQFCAPNEKVTVLKFGVQIAGCMGSFKLVFPAEFITVLINQIKQDQPQKKKRVQKLPMPPLRERILDCEFEVSSELPCLSVAVRDLIALQPGSVLKLRAPIRNPGMLTAGGRHIFEAVPVRNGTQSAAQLGPASHIHRLEEEIEYGQSSQEGRRASICSCLCAPHSPRPWPLPRDLPGH